MPPRLNIWGACRTLAVRSRPLAQCQQPRIAALARGFSDDTTIPPRILGQNGDGNGLPPSMAGSSPGSAAPAGAEASIAENSQVLDELELMSYGLNPFNAKIEGHKYGLPDLPLPSPMHMKHRYDPVVDQLTKLIMRDGKLSKAQRDMAMILNYLRTSPVPKINPSRPLLPGAPPPQHLPLNPILYLTLAVDSVAPLIRIRGYKGLAGGGRSLEIPMPLHARQRRRIAFKWILDAVDKKPAKGSGRTMFAHKVAEEIVAVIEGRSSVWDKRQLVHKQGTAARANMNSPALRRKR